MPIRRRRCGRDRCIAEILARTKADVGDDFFPLIHQRIVSSAFGPGELSADEFLYVF